MFSANRITPPIRPVRARRRRVRLGCVPEKPTMMRCPSMRDADGFAGLAALEAVVRAAPPSPPSPPPSTTAGVTAIAATAPAAAARRRLTCARDGIAQAS
jgi:hypothetical protein